MFNYVHEEKDFSYCIFSSSKSIQLIVDSLEPNERFYLIDGTFDMTPLNSLFKQVLIIHAQFGVKVSDCNMKIPIFLNYENVFFITISIEFSISCRTDVE